MFDLILKYLPLLVFLAPFFVWLDKSKRFTHRRKFYFDRLDAIKYYLSNYYTKDCLKIEKDCAAQALIGSEKVSHLEVDYVITHFPQRFFIMIKKLISARHIIETKIINEEIVLVTKSSKNSYKKKRLILAATYFFSMIIISINEIGIYIMNCLGFQAFEVSNLTLLISSLIAVCTGIFIAIISGVLYFSIDATIEIYDDLNVTQRVE